MGYEEHLKPEDLAKIDRHIAAEARREEERAAQQQEAAHRIFIKDMPDSRGRAPSKVYLELPGDGIKDIAHSLMSYEDAARLHADLGAFLEGEK